jgi:hypothetical protein
VLFVHEECAKRRSKETKASYFTSEFTVVRPIHRVNVDLTPGMLREVDRRAERLNISRQAVVKTLLQRGIDKDHPGKTGTGR